jgi:hypothetical protein
VAAAFSAKGMGGDQIPQTHGLQAQFRGAEEICGGNAHVESALKFIQKVTGTGDGNGSNDAIFQALFENVQIIGNDFGVFAIWQAMARQDFGDNVFIIANCIGISVAGKIFQPMAPFKGNKESIFFRAGEFEKHAIDIEDDRCINH